MNSNYLQGLDILGSEEVVPGANGVAKSTATFAKYLPYMIFGGVVLAGYGIYKIASGSTGQRLAKRVRKR